MLSSTTLSKDFIVTRKKTTVTRLQIFDKFTLETFLLCFSCSYGRLS